MSVEFEDHRAKIKQSLNKKSISFLHEAKDSLAAQASRNSPIDTGALKQSFQNDSLVLEEKLEAYVGSTLEHSIWQELGTGEYALEGNGRKGGWVYKDDEGNYHFTRGNKPKRMLYSAYQHKKGAIKKRAQEIFKG